MSDYNVKRHDISFDSNGDTCAVWLFLPEGVERPPVVILGHGLGATREMRLDAFADGLASARALGPVGTMRMLPTVAADVVANACGKDPVLIKLAGAPGEKALMSAPDALPGYLAIVPEGGTFVNGVAARFAPTATWHRPGKAARKVTSPILFCICDHDSVTPPEETLAYARTAPRSEIKTYDAGHFDIYLGDAFEAVVADQTEFLTRHLEVTR